MKEIGTLRERDNQTNFLSNSFKALKVSGEALRSGLLGNQLGYGFGLAGH